MFSPERSALPGPFDIRIWTKHLAVQAFHACFEIEVWLGQLAAMPARPANIDASSGRERHTLIRCRAAAHTPDRPSEIPTPYWYGRGYGP